ncbi:MAG: NADPH-dependent glutamate synthase [Candidatus Omnitrophota bacterium]
MHEQPPNERIKNFNEVALGYTADEAIKEAKRCLKCKNPPCVKGCPIAVDIPKFISFIAEGKFKESIDAIKETNFLPAICGRVCPQETQCEVKCVVGKKDEPVNIGKLERFAADWLMQQSKDFANRKPCLSGRQARTENRKEKVAVVGSGPAGLTCAAELAKLGYSVTLFESLHELGGVLIYGIPEFRLPKKILAWEIEGIRHLGVEIKTNTLIGRTKTIDGLRKEGYKAFFIGAGAGLPLFLDIEGENLNGVYSANEFLTRVNLMKSFLFPKYDTPVVIGDKVAVIGAGNVAMDSARCAKRLGAKSVSIIYRRTEKEMPARVEEIEHAKQEGIEFMLLTNPIKIIGNEKGWMREVICQRNELGAPDSSGRRSPVPIPGSEFTLGMDTLICAIGNSPNPLLPRSMPELKTARRGNLEVKENLQTSIEGVFAGGDIVTGSATVISAMGHGRMAAHSVGAYLE